MSPTRLSFVPDGFCLCLVGLQVRRNGHSCLFASPPLGVKSSYRALTRYPGLQVRRNVALWLFFWIPHFCGMTATDCLDCSGMSTLRNDDYRLPGFIPGRFSGFRFSAELQVAVKAMTATDCLDCGGMSTLRSDGCRLPGFIPGCCSGKTFLPLCVSASRCQVVIPRFDAVSRERPQGRMPFSGFRISAE